MNFPDTPNIDIPSSVAAVDAARTAVKDVQGQKVFDFSSFPRDIYMYWAYGELPEMAQLAASSWITKNPSWKFHMVNDSILSRYIANQTVLDLLDRQESLPFKSDLVRTNILAIHGGIYADADVVSSVPLDQWLSDFMAAGFFAYRIAETSAERPLQVRSCSSWFLAAEKGNYIVSALQQAINDDSMHRTEPENYLEWHYTFTALTRTDAKFKQIWDSVPREFALHNGDYGCVLALRNLKRGTTMNSTSCIPVYGRMKGDCLMVKELIDSHCAPLYKMNRHEPETSLGIAKYVVALE